ncbi:Geranylgeranyl transferase type-2 subunit alpha 1-like protein [Drosera capensis]
MHGRPRNPAKREDEAAAAARAFQLRDLQSRFLHNHHQNIYDEEAMEVSARLLEMNPEYCTVWNYRKMAVERYMDGVGGDCDGVEGVLKRELDVVWDQKPKQLEPFFDEDPILTLNLYIYIFVLSLTGSAQAALTVNFKSYGAWHHRKWVLNKRRSSLDKEMELINLFQRKDSRKFHAWNHRRRCSSDEIDELKYTRDVIGKNFSNYSAWHNRRGIDLSLVLLGIAVCLGCLSVILSSLFKRKVEGFFPKEKILNEEYQLVQNAIFTEPDDQSVWFYYLWLLDQTIDVEAPLVISSWPAPGSELFITADGSAAGTVISSFGSYQRWAAYLDLSKVKCGSSETYPVEVRCHHSQGITSFNVMILYLSSLFISTILIQVMENYMTWEQFHGKTEASRNMKEILSNIGKLLLARLSTALDTVVSDDASRSR